MIRYNKDVDLNITIRKPNKIYVSCNNRKNTIDNLRKMAKERTGKKRIHKIY